MRKAKFKRDIAYIDGQIIAYNEILHYLDKMEYNITVLRLIDKVKKEKAECIADKKELYLEKAAEKIDNLIEI